MPEGPKTSPSMRTGTVRCPGCPCASYVPRCRRCSGSQRMLLAMLLWKVKFHLWPGASAPHAHSLGSHFLTTLPKEAGKSAAPHDLCLCRVESLDPAELAQTEAQLCTSVGRTAALRMRIKGIFTCEVLQGSRRLAKEVMFSCTAPAC